MATTATAALKAIIAASATIAPIVAGVTIMSAAPASASCAALPFTPGVYRSSDDGLSRLDFVANDSCNHTIKAYATCADDPTSDCPWGTEPFHRVRNNPDVIGYANHQWNNAFESVTILSKSATQIVVSHYVAYDGETPAPPVTITMTLDR